MCKIGVRAIRVVAEEEGRGESVCGEGKKEEISTVFLVLLVGTNGGKRGVL